MCRVGRVARLEYPEVVEDLLKKIVDVLKRNPDRFLEGVNRRDGTVSVDFIVRVEIEGVRFPVRVGLLGYGDVLEYAYFGYDYEWRVEEGTRAWRVFEELYRNFVTEYVE